MDPSFLCEGCGVELRFPFPPLRLPERPRTIVDCVSCVRMMRNSILQESLKLCQIIEFTRKKELCAKGSAMSFDALIFEQDMSLANEPQQH